MPNPNRFGTMIRAMRERTDLTQAELARRIRKGRGPDNHESCRRFEGRVERGVHTPGSWAWPIYAEELGIPLDELERAAKLDREERKELRKGAENA